MGGRQQLRPTVLPCSGSITARTSRGAAAVATHPIAPLAAGIGPPETQARDRRVLLSDEAEGILTGSLGGRHPVGRGPELPVQPRDNGIGSIRGCDSLGSRALLPGDEVACAPHTVLVALDALSCLGEVASQDRLRGREEGQ